METSLLQKLETRVPRKWEVVPNNNYLKYLEIKKEVRKIDHRFILGMTTILAIVISVIGLTFSFCSGINNHFFNW